MAKGHAWAFKARFRAGAFGWRSQPAMTRVREAVAEIKKVARKEPVVAAEGAVVFFERVSRAIEHVDGSSGSMGGAVNRAIDELVPIVANAPADEATRDGWLERLFEAHAADDIPYIEALADHWGTLCVSRERASAWADRLLGSTRAVLRPDREFGGHFHATPACLSALYHAQRYDELIALLEGDRLLWDDKQWAVRALLAKGEKAEALRYAEACRGPWASDQAIDRLGEEILRSSGLFDEAYRRYGLRANRAGTYLATFRAVAAKYPQMPPDRILADLVATTPGDEGKWFAAAKDAGLYDAALALANRTPCDPKTLARAARDFADAQPAFAVGAGLLSLQWLALGYGYEITSADVHEAYRATMTAAERHGSSAEVQVRVRAIVATDRAGGLVAMVLGRVLGT
jgi:hypothetical protein